MTALVTGASSGIGREYARLLARDYGADLLLVSNQGEALLAVASELREAWGVKVWTLDMDLAAPGAAQKVYDYALSEGLTVDVLINNAGMFFFTPLSEVPPRKAETMVTLHCTTLTGLCHLFGNDMCRRGHGYILNMSSLCNWMEFPGIQTYCATKAFVRAFSHSYRFECKPHGVSVLCVTPGAVDTPLYGLSDKARRRLVGLGISLPPEKLARKALRRLFAGRKNYLPGLVNHLSIPLWRIFPDWLVYFAMKKLQVFNNQDTN